MRWQNLVFIPVVIYFGSTVMNLLESAVFLPGMLESFEFFLPIGTEEIFPLQIAGNRKSPAHSLQLFQVLWKPSAVVDLGDGLIAGIII